MESSNQLRALAHPVRLRILSLLTGADLTAADVARELGITHANASYHLRFLLDAGEIVVSGEETIRGGRARRYRHHWRGGGPAASRAASADPEAAGARRAGGRRGAAAPAPHPPPGEPGPGHGRRALGRGADLGARPGPARGGLRPAPRRRPPATHRGHRAGEPLAVRVRHGRPSERRGRRSARCGNPAFAWYLASRTRQPARA